jgi:hypothetical protein
MSSTVSAAGSPRLVPPLAAALEPSSPDRPLAAAQDGSVSLLVEVDGQVLVVLHGHIGSAMQPEIRELVDDLVTDRAGTAGRPVRVLAEQVSGMELAGVWLLLELRRSARPDFVTVVAPSSAVLDALELHGIRGLVIEP